MFKKLTVNQIEEIIKNEKRGLTIQFKNCSKKQYDNYIEQIEEFKKDRFNIIYNPFIAIPDNF